MVESAESPPPSRRRSSSRPQTMIDTTTHPAEQYLPSRQSRRLTLDRPNGTLAESINQSLFNSGLNGSDQPVAIPEPQAPLQASIPTAIEDVSRTISTQE